jgi:hypothetical protein
MEENVVPTEVAEVEETVVEEKEPIEEVVETVEEVPAPRKQTAQERIDEITKARREAEREKEYWKQVALDKKEEPKPEPKYEPEVPQFQRPTINQFDTTEQYEDALLSWHEKRKESETAVRRQRDEQEENLRRFNTAANDVRKKYPDFDEVVEAPVFSPEMRTSIFQSDTGPELAYFLGLPENRDTANKIRLMPPERQFYEMGKLETRLTLAQKTKKVPSAPAPITPVGMSGSGEVDTSKMSIEEWMAWDKKKTLERIKEKLGG